MSHTSGFCSVCGTPIGPEVRFCPNCGTPAGRTLPQNVTALQQVSAIPQNAACIELTINGYSSSLNPKTGVGSTATEHVRKWEYSTSNIGKTNTNYTLYTFLPKEEHTVDVTIRVEGTDGKDIVNYTLEGISVEKNKMTVISGYLLSMDLTTSVSIEGEWETDIEVEI